MNFNFCGKTCKQHEIKIRRYSNVLDICAYTKPCINDDTQVVLEPVDLDISTPLEYGHTTTLRTINFNQVIDVDHILNYGHKAECDLTVPKFIYMPFSDGYFGQTLDGELSLRPSYNAEFPVGLADCEVTHFSRRISYGGEFEVLGIAPDLRFDVLLGEGSFEFGQTLETIDLINPSIVEMDEPFYAELGALEGHYSNISYNNSDIIWFGSESNTFTLNLDSVSYSGEFSVGLADTQASLIIPYPNHLSPSPLSFNLIAYELGSNFNVIETYTCKTLDLDSAYNYQTTTIYGGCDNIPSMDGSLSNESPNLGSATFNVSGSKLRGDLIIGIHKKIGFDVRTCGDLTITPNNCAKNSLVNPTAIYTEVNVIEQRCKQKTTFTHEFSVEGELTVEMAYIGDEIFMGSDFDVIAPIATFELKPLCFSLSNSLCKSDYIRSHIVYGESEEMSYGHDYRAALVDIIGHIYSGESLVGDLATRPLLPDVCSNFYMHYKLDKCPNVYEIEGTGQIFELPPYKQFDIIEGTTKCIT